MDPKGEVGQELMAAAGVSGIPHAFVVDAGGTVQFSGHPMEPGFEAAVQKVLHWSLLLLPLSLCTFRKASMSSVPFCRPGWAA